MSTLILGSASPRRAALLAQLGIGFSVRPADIDEQVASGEHHHRYVLRMAREKAQALASDEEEHVLTADTTVSIDGEILGKPRDAHEAALMLKMLSDREHEVCTAVCLATTKASELLMVSTQVRFCALSENLIRDYLATDEPWDKAGAYGIQGLGGCFVESIRGSYSNVVGLPLVETRELLAGAGFTTQLGWESPGE